MDGKMFGDGTFDILRRCSGLDHGTDLLVDFRGIDAHLFLQHILNASLRFHKQPPQSILLSTARLQCPDINSPAGPPIKVGAGSKFVSSRGSVKRAPAWS